MNNNEVIEILNNLIETCRDGRDGYRAVAESIRDSEFRRLFNIFSQQRAQFITELQSEVHRLGGEPNERNTAGNKLHRGWMDYKSAMSLIDEGSLIAECQGGEQETVRIYQESLKTDLPLDIQYVVKRQYMDIKDAFDRIRILQRAA